MKMIQKVGLGSVAFLAAGSAFAALDPDISSALEAAKTDGVAVAGLVLGVIIAIAAFKYIRRAL
ncbi:major capsid protein [Stutzerimonas nitrititolerans]|uniref:major capsid protein n=1 Tax=Stutzerimonas nitrititolerans TaxID=2482751 RepID=UPI0028983A66|nr:major capsid protein [Stutzerimonas nitrititolerans]